MSGMTTIKRAVLTSKHLFSGGVTGSQHPLINKTSSSLHITELVIAQAAKPEGGFFLMHMFGGVVGADSWHQSIDDALHQAAYEFNIQPDEWVDINEPL